MVWTLNRLMALLAGVLIGQQSFPFILPYLMEDGKTTVLPIWSILIPVFLGIAIAIRGMIKKYTDATTAFILIGILGNFCAWMHYNSIDRMVYAVWVAPLLTWYLFANGDKYFGNEKDPKQIIRAKRIIAD